MNTTINNIFERTLSSTEISVNNIFERTTSALEHIANYKKNIEDTDDDDDDNDIFELTTSLINVTTIPETFRFSSVKVVDVNEIFDYTPIIIISCFFLFFVFLVPCVTRCENQE